MTACQQRFQVRQSRRVRRRYQKRGVNQQIQMLRAVVSALVQMGLIDEPEHPKG